MFLHERSSKNVSLLFCQSLSKENIYISSTPMVFHVARESPAYTTTITILYYYTDATA